MTQSLLDDPEEPVKYLCLVYHDESRVDALPASEYDEIVSDAIEHREVIHRSGHHIVSSLLQPVRSATTIRVRNGMMSITDGPFAETREQLGGFYLIEAIDLNDAIRVVSKMPSARIGCIEVRPLKEMSDIPPQTLGRETQDAREDAHD